MNPMQVIDIGDNDHLVVLTKTQTLQIGAKWDNKPTSLGKLLRELVKAVIPHGGRVVKAFDLLYLWDFIKVQGHLQQAINEKRCFLYVIDDVGKLPLFGRRRPARIRPAKGQSHIDLYGIIPNTSVWVEQRDKDRKYLLVRGYD